jgi:hypothetical protein
MKKTAKISHYTDTPSFFEPIAKAFLKQEGVAEKKMFGTTALTIQGKVFAFPWKGKLVLKLSKGRVAEMVASKKGVYFDPGHGRISKEWVTVEPKLSGQWHSLAVEAKEFVTSCL